MNDSVTKISEKNTYDSWGGEINVRYFASARADLFSIKQSAQYLESSILSAFTGRTDEAQLYATTGEFV